MDKGLASVGGVDGLADIPGGCAARLLLAWWADAYDTGRTACPTRES